MENGALYFWKRSPKWRLVKTDTCGRVLNPVKPSKPKDQAKTLSEFVIILMCIRFGSWKDRATFEPPDERNVLSPSVLNLIFFGGPFSSAPTDSDSDSESDRGSGKQSSSSPSDWGSCGKSFVELVGHFWLPWIGVEVLAILENRADEVELGVSAATSSSLVLKLFSSTVYSPTCKTFTSVTSMSRVHRNDSSLVTGPSKSLVLKSSHKSSSEELCGPSNSLVFILSAIFFNSIWRARVWMLNVKRLTTRKDQSDASRRTSVTCYGPIRLDHVWSCVSAQPSSTVCNICSLAVFFNLSHIRHLKSHLFAPQKWDLVGVASILRVVRGKMSSTSRKCVASTGNTSSQKKTRGDNSSGNRCFFFYEVWEHFRLQVRKVEGAKTSQTLWWWPTTKGRESSAIQKQTWYR